MLAASIAVGEGVANSALSEDGAEDFPSLAPSGHGYDASPRGSFRRTDPFPTRKLVPSSCKKYLRHLSGLTSDPRSRSARGVGVSLGGDLFHL
jgi:hypothetical protein